MILVLLLIQSGFAANQSAFKMDQLCFRQANQQLRNLIERMIEEVKERIKCIVYIADSYYRKVINFGQIKVDHIFPIYQLKIRDSEEFSPPRNRVISILKNSRNAACNLYIILIANGLQNLKLIQFAEEQRYIDTRAMFILMNDFRLLHPEMQFLWNRIINVIFIRRYSAFKRRSGEQLFREWYDLNTIYYPAKIKGLVQTKYIDSFYRGRFRYGTDHFPQKTKNLQHKRLRVAVFQHIPAVTKIAEDFYKNTWKKTSQALGLEFELMKIIAKAINFQPLFYTPNNIKEEKWGNVGENETSGLLGEAVARKAAFYLGDLHYIPRHLNIMDLAWPYNIECLTFLTPESLTENSWKLLIIPFKLYSWILVILTLLIGGIVIHLFALFYEKRIILCKIGGPNIEKTKKQIMIIKKDKTNFLKEKLDEEMEGLYLFSNPQNSMLYTYSMLLQVSLPMLPKAFAVRVFIGCWWLYTILITVSYRASMTAALANPVARMTIDSVEQLAKTPIIAGSWGYEKKEFFLSSEDQDLQKVGRRFEMIGNEDDAVARVTTGRFCYYENIFVLRQARVRRQILEAKMRKNATDRNQNVATDRELHVMEECVINMPVSLGLDKNSPLKPRVDKLVRRAVEAGLLQKWLKDVMEWSKITEMRQENESEKALVNFHKLQGALVALGIGYFFSFLALTGEILHWKYIVMRNPLFDKYHLDLFYNRNKI